MKICYFCKGHVTSKSINYMARQGDDYTLVKNLPAEMCEQCGEVYLDLSASRRVDEALSHSRDAREHLSIPVVSCV